MSKFFFNVNERTFDIKSGLKRNMRNWGFSSLSVKKCRNKFASEYMTG